MDRYSFLLSATEIEEKLDSTIEEANKLLETLEGYIPKIFDFALSVVIALVILFIGRIIIKYILKLCGKFFERAKVEITIRRFFESLIKAILYVILIVILCDIVGIDTTSFIAVLGSLGLTVGLALQGSLSNFAGGVLILMLKPFKVGDYIVDGSSGLEGTVNRIDLFYTKLITIDNKAVSIPNGALSNATITNVTEMDTRRVEIDFGISYGADIDLAKSLIHDVAKNDKASLTDMGISVFVKELAASQVTITLRVWCATDNYWDVKWRITEKVKKVLDENQIEIPFDQLQIHISKES